MLTLLPILLLCLAPVGMAIIHRARSGSAPESTGFRANSIRQEPAGVRANTVRQEPARFRPDSVRLGWLLAFLAALLSWLLVLLSGLRQPQVIPLLVWNRAGTSQILQPLFSAAPALRVDAFSWPFALALATLLLAVLLTDLARPGQGRWAAWAWSCFLTALGLLGVQAANPLTLLLAWSAIDLAELFILLTQVRESHAREGLVIAFSARVGGSMLILWAGTAARLGGASLDFNALQPATSLYLLLAAGLRLGVLPLNLPYQQELPLPRGLGVSVRLAPAASSLVLLARSAGTDLAPALSLLLAILAGLAALYAGIAWAFAQDELAGQPFWLLGISALAVAAAARAQPGAALAWGAAGLLSGGLLFLSYARPRSLRWLSALGLLGLTALPLTPAWSGAEIYIPYPVAWHNLSLALFLLAQMAFLAGYARFALHPGELLDKVERWVWIVYPLGLALLALSHFLLGWRFFPAPGALPLAAWLAGPVALALVALAWAVNRRSPEAAAFRRLSLGLMAAWPRVFSLSWLYRPVWLIYQGIRRILDGVTLLLEGEAGFLWALLLLALIFTVFVQGGPGG